jgi:hypothetical protein
MTLVLVGLWIIALTYTLFKFHNQRKKVKFLRNQTEKFYGKESQKGKRKESQSTKEGNDNK